MIAFLRGILIRKAPTEIVVDINGIGYAVSVPLSTYEKLGDLSAEVSPAWGQPCRPSILS